MNPTLIASVAGLVTAACFGAGDWLTPRSKKTLSAWQINFVVNAIGAAIFLVILAFSSPHWPDANQWVRIIGGSALISVGYAIFVKALTIGAVGIVVPLSSTYPLVTLLLSIVFLGQTFGQAKVLAMIIIVVGAGMLAYEKNHKGVPLQRLHQASIFTMVAVLLWGTGFFIINPIIPEVNWQILAASLDSVGLVLGSLILIVAYKRRALAAGGQGLANPVVQQASILLAIGTLALYAGASRAGSIIIPVVLSSLSPLVSSSLGAIVDHERLGPIKRLGALTAVAGVIILNVA